MHVSIIAAETGSPDLLEALGIDWKLLVTQAIAFAILVWVLGKFVYPALIKAIDDRRSAIEAGLEEAKRSQEALEEAEAKVEKLLVKARKEADEIVARSQQEAAALIGEAEKKAKTRADAFLKDAKSQLETDIIKARATLKSDAVKLVGMATERVIRQKLDTKKDTELIEQSLSEERA